MITNTIVTINEQTYVIPTLIIEDEQDIDEIDNYVDKSLVIEMDPNYVLFSRIINKYEIYMVQKLNKHKFIESHINKPFICLVY